MAPMVDEVVPEAESMAAKVVDKAVSTTNKLVAGVASTAGDVVAASVSTVDKIEAMVTPLLPLWRTSCGRGGLYCYGNGQKGAWPCGLGYV